MSDHKMFHAVIEEAVASGVPGIQAYVRSSELIWHGAAGLSSVEEKTPMQVSDRIRLASITKMMTYAAVEELIRASLLHRTDHAVDLLPEGVLDGIPYADEITVTQLLDHTSGLHNFNGEDGDDFFAALFEKDRHGRCRWDPVELLSYAKKPEHRPTGKPGEGFVYSSTGFIVLQMVLESLEKKPYARVVQDLLLEPLDMGSTGIEGVNVFCDDIVHSYARPDQIASRSSPFDGRLSIRPDGLVNLSAGLVCYNAWAMGAGAAASNVLDLGRFMEALQNGRIGVMYDQEARLSSTGSKPGHTLSWNGGSWGIQTSILFDVQRSITAIVLMNASNVGRSSYELAQKLITIVQ